MCYFWTIEDFVREMIESANLSRDLVGLAVTKRTGRPFVRHVSVVMIRFYCSYGHSAHLLVRLLTCGRKIHLQRRAR